MPTLSGLTWPLQLLQKLKAMAEAVFGPHQKGMYFPFQQEVTVRETVLPQIKAKDRSLAG